MCYNYLSFVRSLLALALLVIAIAGSATAQERWFEQDTLNPGLGPPPNNLDRATPMSTVEAFLYYTERGHFSQAAHLLDLTALPPADQVDAGRARAEMLAVVLKRKVVMPWGSIADRPDGWLVGSSDNSLTGRVRRSILLDTLELGQRRVPVRVNRIKTGDDTPAVWVFSQQTVDNIPQLFAAYGPTPLEKSLPNWARQRSVFGMYVWEILFVPMLLAGALTLAVLLYRSLKRLGETANSRWLRFFARSFKWPAAIIVCAGIIGYATNTLFVVTGLLDAILVPILTIAYVFAASLAAVLVIDETFEMISKSNPNELADPENAHMRSLATNIAAARKFVIVIAVLVGTGVVLTSISTFDNLGFSLLASAGALTIVLGFAAREVLGNILASVQIALNRSARIGDQLMFEGHFCTVERIHFTYVQLMIWNGTRLVVPVSYFVKDPFENWSMEDPSMVRPILMTLAQTTDVDAMRTAFMDIIGKEDPDDVHPIERASVRVVDQDVFGVKVRFELPAANPATGWDLECRVREALQVAAKRLEQDREEPILPTRPDDLPDG